MIFYLVSGGYLHQYCHNPFNSFSLKMIQKWHSSLPLLALQIQFWLEPDNHLKNVLGSRAEAVLLFSDLGNSSRIILGSTRQYLKRAGEIWALFSGSKGALKTTGLVWTIHNSNN